MRPSVLSPGGGSPERAGHSHCPHGARILAQGPAGAGTTALLTKQESIRREGCWAEDKNVAWDGTRAHACPDQAPVRVWSPRKCGPASVCQASTEHLPSARPRARPSGYPLDSQGCQPLLCRLARDTHSPDQRGQPEEVWLSRVGGGGQVTCWSGGPDKAGRVTEQREQQEHGEGGGKRRWRRVGIQASVQADIQAVSCYSHRGRWQPVPGRTYPVVDITAKRFSWIISFSARNTPVRTELL